jgi:hypothetical protein
MTPKRQFHSDDALIVHLVQQFEPSYFPEFLKWTAVWRRDPRNGRGPLPAPVGESLQRGGDLFWEIIDAESAVVQCFLAPTVRLRLEAQLREYNAS